MSNFSAMYLIVEVYVSATKPGVGLNLGDEIYFSPDLLTRLRLSYSENRFKTKPRKRNKCFE